MSYKGEGTERNPIQEGAVTTNIHEADSSTRAETATPLTKGQYNQTRKIRKNSSSL